MYKSSSPWSWSSIHLCGPSTQFFLFMKEDKILVFSYCPFYFFPSLYLSCCTVARPRLLYQLFSPHLLVSIILSLPYLLHSKRYLITNWQTFYLYFARLYSFHAFTLLSYSFETTKGRQVSSKQSMYIQRLVSYKYPLQLSFRSKGRYIYQAHLKIFTFASYAKYLKCNMSSV